jgi:hypothetical protein
LYLISTNHQPSTLSINTPTSHTAATSSEQSKAAVPGTSHHTSPHWANAG